MLNLSYGVNLNVRSFPYTPTYIHCLTYNTKCFAKDLRAHADVKQKKLLALFNYLYILFYRYQNSIFLPITDHFGDIIHLMSFSKRYRLWKVILSTTRFWDTAGTGKQTHLWQIITSIAKLVLHVALKVHRSILIY